MELFTALVIYGIITLPSFILSGTLMIKCIFTGQKYSPDGKLFASRSPYDSRVGVWDTWTRWQVSNGPLTYSDRTLPWCQTHCPLVSTETQYVSMMSLSAIQTLKFRAEEARTWHLHEMEKIGALSPDFGLRIWDLTDERWHSSRGSELILQSMTDG